MLSECSKIKMSSEYLANRNVDWMFSKLKFRVNVQQITIKSEYYLIELPDNVQQIAMSS